VSRAYFFAIRLSSFVSSLSRCSTTLSMSSLWSFLCTYCSRVLFSSICTLFNSSLCDLIYHASGAMIREIRIFHNVEISNNII
jgi:hypothetical protein